MCVRMFTVASSLYYPNYVIHGVGSGLTAKKASPAQQQEDEDDMFAVKPATARPSPVLVAITVLDTIIELD
jgi:hypothetical protein